MDTIAGHQFVNNLIFHLFFGQKYIENVKQDASIGTNILRVSASDEDADNNGAIVYSITAPYNPQDMDYFEIQPESGWIVLKKPLDVSVFPVHTSIPFVPLVQLIDQNNPKSV